MTGYHIKSFLLSDCIWHCFFDPRPDFMVPKASSKVKVVAVLCLPKAQQLLDKDKSQNTLESKDANTHLHTK